MLHCVLDWAADIVHDILRGKFLVPSNCTHCVTPFRDFMLNTIFFVGAIFGPLYYCVIRDIIRRLRRYKYKIVRVQN